MTDLEVAKQLFSVGRAALRYNKDLACNMSKFCGVDFRLLSWLKWYIHEITEVVPESMDLDCGYCFECAGQCPACKFKESCGRANGGVLGQIEIEIKENDPKLYKKILKLKASNFSTKIKKHYLEMRRIMWGKI